MIAAFYGLFNAQVTFLPLGADRNTAVYRVMAEDGTPYFLKLRSGPFDETCVELPKFYSDQGIRQIIAPLVTKNGKLWGNLDIFKTVLYPFVDGHNAYEVEFIGSSLDGVWYSPQRPSHYSCAQRSD